MQMILECLLLIPLFILLLVLFVVIIALFQYLICCIYYLFKGIVKQITESIYWLYHDIKVKYYKRKFTKKNKRDKEIFKDLKYNEIEIEINNFKSEQHRKEIIANIQLYLQREGYTIIKPTSIQDMGEKTKTLCYEYLLKEYNKNVKEV